MLWWSLCFCQDLNSGDSNKLYSQTHQSVLTELIYMNWIQQLLQFYYFYLNTPSFPKVFTTLELFPFPPLSTTNFNGFRVIDPHEETCPFEEKQSILLYIINPLLMKEYCVPLYSIILNAYNVGRCLNKKTHPLFLFLTVRPLVSCQDYLNYLLAKNRNSEKSNNTEWLLSL